MMRKYLILIACFFLAGVLQINLANTAGYVDQCPVDDQPCWKLSIVSGNLNIFSGICLDNNCLMACTDNDGDKYVAESDYTLCLPRCGPAHNEACIGDNDCNDANLNAWRNVAGLKVDEDWDGWGVGNVQQACVGKNMFINGKMHLDDNGRDYKFVVNANDGEDCDDHNNEVHPGAVEICDDGIDNDCNGLADCNDVGACLHVPGEIPEGCESATVSPGIYSANPSMFCNGVNYGPGLYNISYVGGAMKYDSDDNGYVPGFPEPTNRDLLWGVHDPFPPYNDYNGFQVIPSNFMAPGNKNYYNDLLSAEQGNKGLKKVFYHAGGPIGIYLHDSPYSDNVAGSPSPTWKIEATNYCNAPEGATYCGDGIVQTPNSNGFNEQCEPVVPGVSDAFCLFDCKLNDGNQEDTYINTTLSEDIDNPSWFNYAPGLVIPDSIVAHPTGSVITDYYFADSGICNDIHAGEISLAIDANFAYFDQRYAIFGCAKIDGAWYKSPNEYIYVNKTGAPDLFSCILKNAQINLIDSNFNGYADTGEGVSLEGTITGDCSDANHFQIDADGLGCHVEFIGGQMPGIFSSVSILPADISVGGIWAIPLIPEICKGKKVDATEGRLWKGVPSSGIMISNAASASGSLTFFNDSGSDSCNKIINVNWKNLNGIVINSAYANDTVLLFADTSFFAGTPINFKIYKKQGDILIREINGITVAGGSSFVPWFISDADRTMGNNGDKFYFNASSGCSSKKSGDLTIASWQDPLPDLYGCISYGIDKDACNTDSSGYLQGDPMYDGECASGQGDRDGLMCRINCTCIFDDSANICKFGKDIGCPGTTEYMCVWYLNPNGLSQCIDGWQNFSYIGLKFEAGNPNGYQSPDCPDKVVKGACRLNRNILSFFDWKNLLAAAAVIGIIYLLIRMFSNKKSKIVGRRGKKR